MKKSIWGAAGLAALLVMAPAAAFAVDEAPPAEESVQVVEETVEEVVETPPAEETVTEEVAEPLEQPAPETAVKTQSVVETTTLRWILPNGGTPENVTWPQPEATEANLALVPCGESVWIQVDVGPAGEVADSFNDDGQLDYKEDWGWVQSWSFEQYTAPDCAPPVVNECTDGVDTHSTNLNDLWQNVDTRSKGHIEYVENGLHIWTEDSSSQSKVSEGIAVSIKGHDIGVLDIDATAQPGNVYPYGPGLNLFIDVTGDLVADGTLVYEEVYGQDLWVTNGSAQSIKDASDHTGGNGSENHGTINKFLETFPDFTVVGLAYALGSGVQGDWVINSITAGCATHTFDYEVVVPEQPEPTVTVETTSDTDCETGFVTETTTTTTSGRTEYDAYTNTWVAIDDLVEVTSSTREATPEECPVVVPPTEEPPAEEEPSPNAALAQTGQAEFLIPMGVGLGIALLAVGGLMIALRHRRAHN